MNNNFDVENKNKKPHMVVMNVYYFDDLWHVQPNTIVGTVHNYGI